MTKKTEIDLETQKSEFSLEGGNLIVDGGRDKDGVSIPLAEIQKVQLRELHKSHWRAAKGYELSISSDDHDLVTTSDRESNFQTLQLMEQLTSTKLSPEIEYCVVTGNKSGEKILRICLWIMSIVLVAYLVLLVATRNFELSPQIFLFVFVLAANYYNYQRFKVRQQFYQNGSDFYGKAASLIK